MELVKTVTALQDVLTISNRSKPCIILNLLNVFSFLHCLHVNLKIFDDDLFEKGVGRDISATV